MRVRSVWQFVRRYASRVLVFLCVLAFLPVGYGQTKGVSNKADDVGRLIRQLHDSDPWTRKDAASKLGFEKGPRSVAALRDALKDPDAGVARAAADSLIWLGASAVDVVVGKLVLSVGYSINGPSNPSVLIVPDGGDGLEIVETSLKKHPPDWDPLHFPYRGGPYFSVRGIIAGGAIIAVEIKDLGQNPAAGRISAHPAPGHAGRTVLAHPSNIDGWISDSMCGAKHAGSGAACVKKCIEGGMAPVFVDEAKKAVWTIDNPEAVKGFYGDHVTVTATADDAKKSVHIEAIAEAK